MRGFQTFILFAVLGALGPIRDVALAVEPAPAPMDQQSQAHDHANDPHAHPAFGPHAGPLLELGKKQYHAEFVLDEKKNRISVYLLDALAEQAIAKGPKFVLMDVSYGEKTRQYRIEPVPATVGNEAAGSTYAAISPDLMKDLHAAGAKIVLSVVVNGETFTASVKHYHLQPPRHKHKRAPQDSEVSAPAAAIPGAVGSRRAGSQHPTMPWAKKSKSR